MEWGIGGHGMQKGDLIHTRAQVREKVTDPFSALAVLFELPLGPNDSSLFALASATEGGDGDGFAIQWIKSWLIIECIDLAGPTVHEQENDALGLGCKVRGFGREWIGNGTQGRSPGGFQGEEFVQREQAAQRQAGKPPACLPKELSPRATAEILHAPAWFKLRVAHRLLIGRSIKVNHFVQVQGHK